MLQWWWIFKSVCWKQVQWLRNERRWRWSMDINEWGDEYVSNKWSERCTERREVQIHDVYRWGVCDSNYIGEVRVIREIYTVHKERGPCLCQRNVKGTMCSFKVLIQGSFESENEQGKGHVKHYFVSFLSEKHSHGRD